MIIMIFISLLGAGAVWYVYTRPMVITGYMPLPDGESSRSTENIEKDNIFNIEKIINEVPFREIKITKQEYEILGWNKYENKEIGFEIYYPSDWKVSESKGRGDTSDDPSYMSITFAPKTLSYDFTFALYIFKEPLKERLLKLADREWLPIEKLRINNTDAVIIGRYSSEKNKHTNQDVIFGSDNWTIGFVGGPNNPSVYERMFKSFRLFNKK